MKKIVCFGDSNTYGFNPENLGRYDENIRWTGILKNKLKETHIIIEAGYNNRNCFKDNPDNDELTGYKALPKYINIETDILILLIGTNDLQIFYKPTYEEITKGIKQLIELALKINNNIKIVLAAPAKLTDDILNGFFSFQFDKESIEKSYKLPEIYKKVSDEYNCIFVDINDFAKVSKTDGLHFDKTQHKRIAEAFEDIIKTI